MYGVSYRAGGCFLFFSVFLHNEADAAALAVAPRSGAGGAPMGQYIHCALPYKLYGLPQWMYTHPMGQCTPRTRLPHAPYAQTQTFNHAHAISEPIKACTVWSNTAHTEWCVLPGGGGVCTFRRGLAGRLRDNAKGNDYFVRTVFSQNKLYNISKIFSNLD